MRYFFSLISIYIILVLISMSNLIFYLKSYAVSFSPLQHAEMADESVQLKTLQTILIIYQSRLHPDNEVIKVIQFHFLQKLDV